MSETEWNTNFELSSDEEETPLNAVCQTKLDKPESPGRPSEFTENNVSTHPNRDGLESSRSNRRKVPKYSVTFQDSVRGGAPLQMDSHTIAPTIDMVLEIDLSDEPAVSHNHNILYLTEFGIDFRTPAHRLVLPINTDYEVDEELSQANYDLETHVVHVVLRLERK